MQDREAQRRSLKERLVALEPRRGIGPLRADADIITGQLARLNDLLGRDIARANAFFRAHVAPITCTPVREAGRKFYRATAAANGSEMIKGPQLRGRFDVDPLRGPQSEINVYSEIGTLRSRKSTFASGGHRGRGADDPGHFVYRRLVRVVAGEIEGLSVLREGRNADRPNRH